MLSASVSASSLLAGGSPDASPRCLIPLISVMSWQYQGRKHSWFFLLPPKRIKIKTRKKKHTCTTLYPPHSLLEEQYRNPVQVTERIWWSSRCPTGCWSGNPVRAVAPPPAVCGWRTEACPGSAVADSQSQICPPGWPFCNRTAKRAISLFACQTLKVTRSKFNSWHHDRWFHFLFPI